MFFTCETEYVQRKKSCSFYTHSSMHPSVRPSHIHWYDGEKFCFFAHPAIHPSIHPSTLYHLCSHPSIQLSHPSVQLFIPLSLHASIHPSISPSHYPGILVSICPSIHPTSLDGMEKKLFIFFTQALRIVRAVIVILSNGGTLTVLLKVFILSESHTGRA